ncbi:hypothetical protein TNCV_153551 [Trichonephila clavipes]|nr:hypothetical protein TNCV_153551 [Trichonephila clavipes]
MIVITAEIESRFAEDNLLPFRCRLVSSCAAPVQTEASMSGRHVQHTLWAPRSQMSFSQGPSYGSRRHRGPSEGATCAWMATDGAVGCMHAFLKMLWSSRRQYGENIWREYILHYGSGGLMDRVGITLDGRTHLHVFSRATETAVRYKDEVLEFLIHLFMEAVGSDLLLMDDNVRHITLI